MSINRTISCIIVDDDPAYLEILRSMVAKNKDLESLGEYEDSTEGFNAIIEHNPDFVFLDVEMPNMSGLEVLESLKQSIPIILISSKEDYALKAFNFDAVDYVTKPINYPRFVQAVNKVRRFITSSSKNIAKSDQLFVKVGSSFKNVQTENILYVQAYGDFVKIFTKSEMLTVHTTLKLVEESLPVEDFVRVHRSYVVRIDQISDFNQSNLILQGRVIPISHRNRKQLMEKLNTL